MARKNDDNFYRRQQDEANRLAATQNRHLNEIAKLAKSSVEEMRKMRRAFETFAEAMLGMKIEPFQGAVLSEAARGQIAEFDIKGFKETLLKGEALTVPEGEPYPEVQIEPDHSKKRVETHAELAPRLGFGDVVDSKDERTAPPLVVVDEAEEGSLRWKHKLSDEAAERLEEVMGEGGGDPLPLDRDAMFACPSDCALDHEHIAAHGNDPAFWHEPDPEEECADVSEARRTPQGHAAGGYTGVSYWATEEEQERLGVGQSKFGVPINQLAGIVHQGIFSDTTIPEKNARALSQYAADAERQRRDGLASY